ncbi:hypothetical protein IE53DRAFT_33199 [Violaceomyces palustris]|uniref:Uncharacterized protein n=1 Tax=Violaceomyces palustris TaxID=1673888 RepID=A0ACD0P1B5_9BASI|nr:hypothetical protein IE53DRAFT_33199 [Violaceomyces palustris]
MSRTWFGTRSRARGHPTPRGRGGRDGWRQERERERGWYKSGVGKEESQVARDLVYPICFCALFGFPLYHKAGVRGQMVRGGRATAGRQGSSILCLLSLFPFSFPSPSPFPWAAIPRPQGGWGRERGKGWWYIRRRHKKPKKDRKNNQWRGRQRS